MNCDANHELGLQNNSSRFKRHLEGILNYTDCGICVFHSRGGGDGDCYGDGGGGGDDDVDILCFGTVCTHW
jgi:hypothetical protein